jgi:poly-gamma-glutamate synthesis protein (capsule biosynthesis protein)
MSLDIAIGGDLSINRRISVSETEKFHQLLCPFREACIGFAHLETILHDYDGPEVYPATEVGGTWQCGPPYVAEELRWMGLDVVSTPSNHALDYLYGGLRSTWEALRNAGLEFVGTGDSLGDARSPTYIETPEGVVAIISMTSSFTP